MRGYASKVFPPKMLHFIEELIYYGAYNLSGTSILGPKKEKKKRSSSSYVEIEWVLKLLKYK